MTSDIFPDDINISQFIWLSHGNFTGIFPAYVAVHPLHSSDELSHVTGFLYVMAIPEETILVDVSQQTKERPFLLQKCGVKILFASRVRL